jgi:hypothetical protein
MKHTSILPTQATSVHQAFTGYYLGTQIKTLLFKMLTVFLQSEEGEALAPADKVKYVVFYDQMVSLLGVLRPANGQRPLTSSHPA